ncbi:hypothetical protein D6U78_10720 [Vibrio cholerae]|nr:hypothetical protein [Vibrio cholerae]
MNLKSKNKRIRSLLVMLTLCTLSPIAAAAPISAAEIIENAMRFVGLVGFAIALFGITWGLLSTLKAWQGLQHGADQQQDPEITKKFMYRMVAGIGAASTIGIMLAVILTLFGTTDVLNFITFDSFTTKSFLQINY